MPFSYEHPTRQSVHSTNPHYTNQHHNHSQQQSGGKKSPKSQKVSYQNGYHHQPTENGYHHEPQHYSRTWHDPNVTRQIPIRHSVQEYSLPAPTKIPAPYYNHLGQLVYPIQVEPPQPILAPPPQFAPIYLSSITKITTTTTATRRASTLSPHGGGVGSRGTPVQTTTTTTSTTSTSAGLQRPPSRAGAGRSPRVSPSPSSPSHDRGRGTAASSGYGGGGRSASPPPPSQPTPTPQQGVPQRSGSTTHIHAPPTVTQQPSTRPGPEEEEEPDDGQDQDPSFRQLDSDQEDPDVQDTVNSSFNIAAAGRGGNRSRSPSTTRAITSTQLRTIAGGGRPTPGGAFDHQTAVRMSTTNVFDSGNDVLLSVGDKEIKANKLILAEKSPIFREMFIDCLIISDVDPEAFETMLAYMYGDEFFVSDELLSLCLVVADKYQVDGFTEALLDHFIDKINSRNCLAMLRGGTKLKEPDEFLERVLCHVDRAIDEVVLQEEWTESPRDILALILGRDGLRMTELDIWHACLEWARCECDRNGLSSTGENLRTVLGECLGLIRFPCMSQAAFTDFVLPELVLVPAEINDVMQFFNKDLPSELFIMAPRTEAKTPDFYPVYRTSALQDNYSYYTPRRIILNATIRVDRKIQILGFDFPQNFSKKRSFLSLYITPKDARGRSKWNLETTPMQDGSMGGRALITGYKLLLDENVEYQLKVTCDLSPGEGFYAPAAPAFEPESVVVDVTSGRMTVDFLDEATLTLSIARQNLTMAIPSILIKPRYF